MGKVDSVKLELTKGRSDLAILTEEQLSWLNKAKRFADAVPLSEVIKSDNENLFLRDLFESACKEGFGALPFPRTYGGAGGDYLSFCLVNEEFARRCLPVMSSLGVHVLCQEPIYTFGSEQQKRKYLPPAATGEYLAAFALTEPAAGSDTANLEASAKLVGNEFILNGTKTFITSGGAADFYIVMARLKDDNRKEGGSGISSFIVEKTFPGFSTGQKFDMLGMRGYATCEIVMNDCRVPKDNLIGEPGSGRKIALSSLGKGRVTIAAQATGWGQGALEAALRLLKKKSAHPANPESYSSSEYLLGSMMVEIESARALTYQAALSIDSGQFNVNLAAMAKVEATDMAMKVSTNAISLTGSQGLKPDFLLERIFRDAKAGQIYEGTNQIQRMLLARNLLEESE
jgi:alkylation response protein AidB-like acyl-CoA dehydrogenase